MTYDLTRDMRHVRTFASGAAANKYTALLSVKLGHNWDCSAATARTCRDNRAPTRLTCIGSGPQVLVPWSDGVGWPCSGA